MTDIIAITKAVNDAHHTKGINTFGILIDDGLIISSAGGVRCSPAWDTENGRESENERLPGTLAIRIEDLLQGEEVDEEAIVAAIELCNKKWGGSMYRKYIIGGRFEGYGADCGHEDGTVIIADAHVVAIVD